MGCVCTAEKKKHKDIESYLKSEEKGKEHKLLLLGPGSTGKTTLFKSLQYAHRGKVPEQDLIHIIPIIRTNTIKYMQTLIRQSVRLYLENPQLNKDCQIESLTQQLAAEHENIGNVINNVNNIMTLNIETTNETNRRIAAILGCNLTFIIDYAANNNNNKNTEEDKVNDNDDDDNKNNNSMMSVDIDINNHASYSRKDLLVFGECIEYLWSLPQIQATYKRRGNNFALEDNTKYFFNLATYIFSDRYQPSEECYLKTKERTIGMIDYKYVGQDKKNYFRILDVGGQRTDRRKWIEHFADVNGLIYVGSLADYNSVLYEDLKNSMLESVEVFAEHINLDQFDNSEIILILNKNDLFVEKLRNNIPLSVCFSKEAGWPWEDEHWHENEHTQYHNPALNNNNTNNNNNNNNSSNNRTQSDSNVFSEKNSHKNNLSINDNFREYWQECVEFIFNIFLKRNRNTNRIIHKHVTVATDNKIVRKLFLRVQTIIIRNNMKSAGLGNIWNDTGIDWGTLPPGLNYGSNNGYDPNDNDNDTDREDTNTATVTVTTTANANRMDVVRNEIAPKGLRLESATVSVDQDAAADQQV